MSYNPDDLQVGSDPADLINDLRGAFAAILSAAHPGYVSGRRYSALVTATPIHTAAVVANTAYCFPIPIFSPVRLASLIMRVGTSVPGVKGRCSLYNNANSVPGKLIFEGANDLDFGAASATELATPLPSDLTLYPDMYWGVAVFDGAAQPTTASSTVVQAGGFTFMSGAGSATSLFTTSPVSRITRTAAVTFLADTPFMPAAFGAVSYGTGAPGSPAIGFIPA